MHAVDNTVHVEMEQRVAKVLILHLACRVRFPRHGIEVDAIFRQRGRQHLPVGRKDIAAGGRQRLVFAFKLLPYRQPIIASHDHEVARFEQNHHTRNGKEYADDLVATQCSFRVVFRLIVSHIQRIYTFRSYLSSSLLTVSS